MKDYQKLINELLADPQKEILIKHDQFLPFHQAWLANPHHGEIVGKALKEGNIIYHYVPKN